MLWARNRSSGNGSANSAATSARVQSCRIAETLLVWFAGCSSMAARWLRCAAKASDHRKTARSLRRDPRLLARRLDPSRTVLELRNLAERIERRVGQQIGGRFHERERNEHNAVRHRIVLARDELDGAATGADTDHVARRDPEFLQLIARERRHRARFDVIEHGRAPG